MSVDEWSLVTIFNRLIIPQENKHSINILTILFIIVIRRPKIV